MSETLGDVLIRWAMAEPSVQLLVMIGSQTRASTQVASADRYSDWDFQLATTQPEMFATAKWTEAAGLKPLHYVFRSGRLGSAQKVTALFAEGELDLITIPAVALRGLAQQKVPLRALMADPNIARALTDLAAVLQGGYRILKGEEDFGAFYKAVASEVPPARLSDAEVRQLVDGFVCDYVSTQGKIDRGEFLAAQRWLHHQLAEVNFKLLHELRQREKQVSFPDARRLEAYGDARVAAVTVAATPDAEALRAAAKQTAATCRTLTEALLGGAWRWPAGIAS